MKHNQLQIDRKYKKLFRGANHVLIIERERDVFVYPTGAYTHYYENDEWFETQVGRVIPEYKFTLQVFDEHLQGQVNGKYVNWTKHLPTVKRKLKRLLRCKKLNIKLS